MEPTSFEDETFLLGVSIVTTYFFKIKIFELSYFYLILGVVYCVNFIFFRMKLSIQMVVTKLLDEM